MSDAARRIAVFIERMGSASPVIARAPKKGVGKFSAKTVPQRRPAAKPVAPARPIKQPELNHNATRLSQQQKDAWDAHSYEQQVEYLKQHKNSIFQKVGITKDAPSKDAGDAQADNDQNGNSQNPQAGDAGQKAGGQEGDGAQDNDAKDDAGAAQDGDSQEADDAPLGKETRQLTDEEKANASARVETLNQPGALDANSPARAESAEALHRDGANVLRQNLPADAQQSLGGELRQMKQDAGGNAEEERIPDDGVPHPLKNGGKWGGFEFKRQLVQHQEEQAKQADLKFRRENQDFVKQENEEDDARENRKLDRVKQDKIDEEKRAEQRNIDRESRDRAQRLEDRDYRHKRKAAKSSKRMKYAVGALVVASLLGVGLFAISPGIAMGVGIHAMDHIGKLLAGSRDDDDDDDDYNSRRRSNSYDSYASMPNDIIRLLAAVEDNQPDAIDELVALSADYVKRGQLPADLLDNLRRQVSL